MPDGSLQCPDGAAGSGAAGTGWAGTDGAAGTGWAGSGSFPNVAGTGGGCDCDDDDPCTEDYCDITGVCHHDNLSGSNDEDQDGFREGCDCNDLSASVYPDQRAYFTQSYSGSAGSGGAGGSGGAAGTGGWSPFPGFDYDCDGSVMLRYVSIASPCELLAGVCIGEGWLPVEGQDYIPGCGQTGSYQVCQASGDGCASATVMHQQSCR